MRGEWQAHGFAYEEEIISRFGMIKEENYVGEWDAYYNDIPVSIKTSKLGSEVGMADFFRNQRTKEDFYLIVGFWSGVKGNIVEEWFLKIPAKDWQALFLEGYDIKLKALLDGITNDRADDKRWTEETKALKKEWRENTPNLIRPRFKRDHKAQKRIQCAITHKDFMEYFIPRYEVDCDEL